MLFVPHYPAGGSEKRGHFGRIVAMLPLTATTSGISRAAGRTIRFWDFPSSGSSYKVKSPVRQPASLVMFLLSSTSGGVVLVVRHFGPFAHCRQHYARRRTSVFQVRPRGLQANGAMNVQDRPATNHEAGWGWPGKMPVL